MSQDMEVQVLSFALIHDPEARPRRGRNIARAAPDSLLRGAPGWLNAVVERDVGARQVGMLVTGVPASLGRRRHDLSPSHR